MTNFFIQSIITFFRFITESALAVIGSILYVFPWLFRLLSILLWITSGFFELKSIEKIYSPFTPTIPLFALQFAVILLMTAWAVSAIKDGKQIWGVLAAGGLAGWAISVFATQLSEHWEYADVFFDVLPPTLFAVGMIHAAIRARARRLSHE